MHVGLADVFLGGVICDEDNTIIPVELRVERLIVIVHARKQRGGSLITVLASKGSVGLCGLKLCAVFSGQRQSILQRQTERLRWPRRFLLRSFGGRRTCE